MRLHHLLIALLAQLLTGALAPAASAETVYPPGIKPIVEKRCMVCHGCYDAPCQLKLDAWTGLERGASKNKVYDGTRLLNANLTRLFEDAHNEQEWRDKGFYPVAADGTGEPGVAQRMLDLKQAHPLPDGERLPDSFDFSLDRNQQCPKNDEFDAFAQDYPLWGMPYGLPGLPQQEHDTLTQWLDSGSPGVPAATPPAAEIEAVRAWEKFLNGESLKEQLMSRYIYEHLFVANIHFRDLQDTGNYYRLVRSRTAPGQPVEIIATRRPYADPGKAPFYYRLERVKTAILAKRHMPYALDDSRMQRWRELFLEPQYEVSALPSYEPAVSNNPFIAFEQLPQQARYKFMLDEARFTIMGFIKGPVCRGQVALNVIDDHFWVVFIDPDRPDDKSSGSFLQQEAEYLRLPSGDSSVISLLQWRQYARNQLKFLEAKTNFILEYTGQDGADLSLDLIWDGDDENDNASLTVFRHVDSATVVKGLVGRKPKTAWIIDYSLLERIHYLLVAGFDVYGNVAHQLETRLYMDFLRMEGEHNFLLMLPPQERVKLRDHWYRGARDHVKQYVIADTVAYDRGADIKYSTDEPKSELLDMLLARQHGATEHGYAISEASLQRLQDYTGAAVSLLPPVSFLEVLRDNGEKQAFTLVHNSGFSNNTQLFAEQDRRLPQEDYVSVVNGFIGSYPNQFFQVPERDLENFVSGILALKKEKDYRALVSRHGVRRNAPWFWKMADSLHDHYEALRPREAGLFDFNRYENR